MFDLEPIKKLILKEIFEGVQKLESFDILDVPGQVISKVARTMAAAEKMWIKIRWMARLLENMYPNKSFYLTAKETVAFSSTCEVIGGDRQGEADARRSSHRHVY